MSRPADRPILPRLRAALVLAAACALGPAGAFAASGEVTHLSGATLARDAGGRTRILSVKSEVREGDLLVTAENTYARIKWADGGELVMRPNTQMKIDAYSYDEQKPQGDNVLMSLIKGGMRSVTGLLGRRTPRGFRIAAPSATIGIRGTHFGVLLCNNDCAGVSTIGGQIPPNGLHIDVADGVVIVTTAVDSREFRIGEFGYVQNVNSPPVPVPQAQGTRIDPPRQILNTIIQGSRVGALQGLECRVSP